MPFACNDRIAELEFEGSIEITDEQYAEALEGILQGMQVTVDGGFKVGFPPPPEPEPVPDPTPEEIKAGFVMAIQSYLDNKAQDFGYDSLLTAISYAEEPAVPKFQNEGKAFRAWRSLVWAYANEQLAKVLSGEIEQPTVDEVLAELPPLVLPK